MTIDDETTPDELPGMPEAAPARRQPGDLCEVQLEGGAVFRVRITNRERIAYEKTAARHKEWPTGAQSFTMTFLTWAAAKRAGLTETKFEEWQEVLLDWDAVEDTSADPTR